MNAVDRLQLMFSEHLNCVVSISRITETAMFIGDLEQKLTNSYFRVTRGINTFDYRCVSIAR